MPPPAQPPRARTTTPAPTPVTIIGGGETTFTVPEDTPGEPVDATRANFRWGAKRYFLTYAQVSLMP